MKPFPRFDGPFSSSVTPVLDGSGLRWISLGLRQLWEVIFSPVAAAAHYPAGPGFLVPLAVLGLISMIVAAVQSPIQIEWMAAQLSSAGAAPAQISSSLDLMRRSAHAGLILQPLFLAAGWMAHALLIWLTAQLFLVSIGYSQTLTVVAYSHIPIVLRDMAACLVLGLRAPEVLMQADGLNIAFGLNLLVPGIPAPWSALTANINPFEAWYVGLLVSGLYGMTRRRRPRILAAVLLVWVFVTLLQFGFVVLGYQLKSQFSRG